MTHFSCKQRLSRNSAPALNCMAHSSDFKQTAKGIPNAQSHQRQTMWKFSTSLTWFPKVISCRRLPNLIWIICKKREKSLSVTDPKACKFFFSKRSSGSQLVTSTLGQCQSCERLQPDPGLLGGCLELAQTLPSVQIPHEPGTGPELFCGYLASRLDMTCI